MSNPTLKESQARGKMGKALSDLGRKKVHKVMSEYKSGSLKSGGKTPVKSRKQAIAIALSEGRKAS